MNLLQNNYFSNKKLPESRKLFLYLLLIAEFICFIFTLASFSDTLIFFIVSLGYYFFSGKNIRKLSGIFIIAFIIFFINLHYKEGKVFFTAVYLEITHDALFTALRKSLVMINLFLLSSNIVFDNKNIFFQSKNRKDSIFGRSLLYFIYIFDTVKPGRHFVKRLEIAVKHLLSDDAGDVFFHDTETTELHLVRQLAVVIILCVSVSVRWLLLHP